MLAKYKLNSIEILISKALINSVISQTKFVLINNVLKKYNEMKNAKVARTKNERIMDLSKCEVCDIKKSKFMKHQEASRFSFVLILFKVGLSPFKNICVICFIESPSKMMKNTSYFILKAPFSFHSQDV